MKRNNNYHCRLTCLTFCSFHNFSFFITISSSHTRITYIIYVSGDRSTLHRHLIDSRLNTDFHYHHYDYNMSSKRMIVNGVCCQYRYQIYEMLCCFGVVFVRVYALELEWWPDSTRRVHSIHISIYRMKLLIKIKD